MANPNRNKKKFASELLKILSSKSKLFNNHQFGLFKGVYTDLPGYLDSTSCAFICTSKMQNSLPIHIILKDIDPIDDYKNASTEYLIQCMEKQNPAILWYMVKMNVNPKCLDFLLSHSDVLRGHLSKRLTPHMFCRFFYNNSYTIDSQYIMDINDVYSRWIFLCSSNIPNIKHLQKMWLHSGHLPITCINMTNIDLLKILMQYGADPHVSLELNNTQIDYLLPELSGEVASNPIKSLRFNFIDFTKDDSYFSTQIHQSYDKESNTSKLKLQYCEIDTKSGSNLTFSINQGISTTFSCDYSSHSLITIIRAGKEVTLTLSSLLNSEKCTLTLSSNTNEPTLGLSFDSTLSLCTKDIAWNSGAQVPNISCPFTINIPISSINHLKTLDYNFNELKHLYLLFYYGPRILYNRCFNLIQYACSLHNNEIVEYLSSKSCDLLHDSDARDINPGIYMVFSSNFQRTLISKIFNNSPSFHLRSTSIMVNLLELGSFNIIRELLLKCRSPIDLEYLCDYFLIELSHIVFTGIPDLNIDLKPEMLKNRVYKYLTHASLDKRALLDKNEVSYPIFNKFLRIAPEIIVTLLNRHSLLPSLHKNLTQLARSAVDKSDSPPLMFLVDHYPHVEVIFTELLQEPSCLRNLKSMSTHNEAIYSYLHDGYPDLFISISEQSDNQIKKRANEHQITIWTNKVNNFFKSIKHTYAQAHRLQALFDKSKDQIHLSELSSLSKKLRNLMTRYTNNLHILLKEHITTENLAHIQNLYTKDVSRHDDALYTLSFFTSSHPNIENRLANENKSVHKPSRADQVATNLSSSSDIVSKTSPDYDNQTSCLTSTFSGFSPKQKNKSETDFENRDSLSYHYHRTCLDLFFKTEFPLLKEEITMQHFVNIRFMIFLCEVNHTSNIFGDIQGICPFDLSHTVRNMYTHHACFFTASVSCDLAQKLSALKDILDENTLSYKNIKILIRDWLRLAYSHGISELHAQINPEDDLSEDVKNYLYTLYSQDYGKRKDRVEYLLSKIVDTTHQSLDRQHISYRLYCMELAEHLRARPTILECSKPDYTALLTSLVSKRHYFLHQFFSTRNALQEIYDKISSDYRSSSQISKLSSSSIFSTSKTTLDSVCILTKEKRDLLSNPIFGKYILNEFATTMHSVNS
ncbi:MAG: hypothetical protein VX112_04810 [Pseudomonadota bacterium]|nr:hypothetical protein [Pseudomonadota bacterium]